ncbi:MAG TPA: universal stress protein [Mycobacterium sp.]|nr:universal stress protein [Mycobacterium sp.]HTX93943.1 universal stress protein [Mycobacterium sp.]
MTDSANPRSIVVGIDGSKAAIRAALWAVDEAVGRDVPLRLVHAVEGGPQTGEVAVRQAAMAIGAAGRPVKTETDVIHGPAVGSLIRASASAAMLCVGAVGLRHFQPGRVGSTAAALAGAAHCPVAIIRSRDDHRRPSADAIVVEVGGSPDNGVLLGAAIEEALLRNAALRVVICRRTGAEDTVADTEGDRRALADVDRRLARWKRSHPELRVESVAVRGSMLEYLSYSRSAALLIVGARNRERVAELVGPIGSSMLQDLDCSLLIVNRQHL